MKPHIRFNAPVQGILGAVISLAQISREDEENTEIQMCFRDKENKETWDYVSGWKTGLEVHELEVTVKRNQVVRIEQRNVADKSILYKTDFDLQREWPQNTTAVTDSVYITEE